MRKSAFRGLNVLLALPVLFALVAFAQGDGGFVKGKQVNWEQVFLQNADKDHDPMSVFLKFPSYTPKFVKDEIGDLLNATYKDANGDGIDDRYCYIADGAWTLYTFKSKKGDDDAFDALNNLIGNAKIAFAQYNYRVKGDVTPNDPRYSELWAMNQSNDCDIDAPEAWDTTTGSSTVIVGIIDTGIDYNHTDLAANVWTNPGEVAGNGVDDDGNGYVDDVHGINAITGTGNPMDDNNHGTHCSGTIGAVGNNSVGVVGVNWNVKMIGMKFLDSSGSGNEADAVECMNYAIGLRNRGINLRVLSNSWGGGGFSQSTQDAITSLNNLGVLFTAAAGNSSQNTDTTANYPSCYPVANVLAVAATTSTDGLASYSNYGATTVDLGAPGSSILSTIRSNSYGTMSGTSMATPHVSGAAALLLSKSGTLTVADLKNYLMNYGDSISALSGRCVSGKRLNLKKSLDAISGGGNTAPTASFTVTPTSGTTATVFSFDASGSSDAQDPTSSLQVRWDWTNDGTYDTSYTTTKTATHQYTANGTYTIKLEVKDTGGLLGTTTKQVTVGDSGGTNLALNKPVTVSRSYSSSYPPANAVDGNESTYWASANVNTYGKTQWIYVNLQAAKSVSKTKLKFSTTNYARTFAVQYYNGSSWVTLKTITTGVGGWNEVTFTSTSAQYFRIYMTVNNSSYYTIYEYQLFQ